MLVQLFASFGSEAASLPYPTICIPQLCKSSTHFYGTFVNTANEAEKKTFFFASEIPPEAPGLDSYELCVITWPDADENGASLSDYM